MKRRISFSVDSLLSQKTVKNSGDPLQAIRNSAFTDLASIVQGGGSRSPPSDNFSRYGPKISNFDRSSSSPKGKSYIFTK